jgi:hypothetical protein
MNISTGSHIRRIIEDFIDSPEFDNWMPLTPERKAAWDRVFWLRNKEQEDRILEEMGL